MRRRLEALERQSRENPEEVGAAIRYAVALDRAGEWRRALDEWERVLELDESCGLAWARAARSLARHGAVHDALEAFQVGLALNAHAPEGLVTKGLKALRERAAALRKRASSISGRFTRRAIPDENTPEALGAPPEAEPLAEDPRIHDELLSSWLTAEKHRLGGELDEAMRGLVETARRLGTDSWPPDEPDPDALVNLGAEHEDCRDLFALLDRDGHLRRDLAAAGCRIFIVGDRLGEPALELPENEPSGVQKLLLKVRHGSDPCGPLGAGTNALPRLATVVVADQKARQFAIEDTAAGEHAGGLSGADLLRRLRLELLARASCRLADEIAARIYGDQESGRLAPILADE